MKEKDLNTDDLFEYIKSNKISDFGDIITNVKNNGNILTKIFTGNRKELNDIFDKIVDISLETNAQKILLDITTKKYVSIIQTDKFTEDFTEKMNKPEGCIIFNCKKNNDIEDDIKLLFIAVIAQKTI